MTALDVPTPVTIGDWPDVKESRTPARLLALKEGDMYLVADSLGDVLGIGDGLFINDTRVLSRWRLTLGGRTPTLLGSSVSQDNVSFTAHVSNRPLPLLGGHSTPEGVIHVERSRFLWDGRLYERVRLSNYGSYSTVFPLVFEFGSDFVDMFEVRGLTRMSRGKRLPPELSDRTAVLSYEGLDKVMRSVMITFSEPPTRLQQTQAEYHMTLPRRESVAIHIELGMHAKELPTEERFRSAAACARLDMRRRRRRGGVIRSSGRLFADWVEKSRADLALLTTDLPTGPYPYAGIPWFATPFGRDAIITALQVLWVDPSLARGVLRFLAEKQAKEVSEFRASAPGKIMHEMRRGEMTVLGEVPYGAYYGGVDTTPLFVMLAVAYARRTADMTLMNELWPALKRAMSWIEDFGDSNGDGFLDYPNDSPTGLTNQGWKDSSDSVFHADGRLPKGPIALVEVQGYAYAAFRGMACLARGRGDREDSKRWFSRATKLKQRIDERFWMADEQFYGIAIDGEGQLCRVRASNPGHLLFTGAARLERVRPVINMLMSNIMNSGWGIRTLATTEARYNPMSYHNGSVWPHDVALCAAGMARYGERDAPATLLNNIFEAAVSFDMRLPELFCGFPRAPGQAPIPYPVACLPQAWAAASVFLMLQACLGLVVNGSTVEVDKPQLPIGVDQLAIRRLSVGDRMVDVVLKRAENDLIAHSIV